MIEVKVSEHGIHMKGHAGCSRNGTDIVCAAVSALTCNLIHSIESLTDNQIRADTQSGMTTIEWEKLSDTGKLLVDAWFLGLAEIKREYNCINFV